MVEVEEVELVEGEDASLRCPVTTDSALAGSLVVRWTRDGGPVAGDEELRISGATAEDSGEYRCVVSSRLEEEVRKTKSAK